jgi:glucokinase
VSDKRVIGIDLGGTKIAVGAVDRSGSVARRHERPTPLESEEKLIEGINAAVEEVLDEDVGALGIGVPSRIDRHTGVAQGSANIPLDDFPLRDRMRERFGLPVAVDNDANAATLAEWKLGAGRGAQNMVMLTLGTGVGGGVVIDGELFRGWAELGHMVLLYDGPPCQGTCTGRGHFEALTSGHAADAAAREAFGPGADGKQLVLRTREGDARAREVLEEFGRRLGAGIGSLVNIFGPEVVVIGGGFGAAAEFLFAPARETLIREALAPAGELVRLVEAELGPGAGLVGAGLVGFEALDTAH